MFVSILQRFGVKFSREVGQPLQSRADQNTQSRALAGAHPEAASQRRQAVKANSAKTTKPASKPAGTLKTVAKSAAKPALKPTPKVLSKPPPKARPKAVAKPAVKPAVKPQKAIKPAAKKAAKPPVKATAKSKPAIKKPAVKAAAKPVAKKLPIKVPAKPIGKPLVKTAPKGAARVAVKTAAKAMPKAPPSAATVTKGKPLATVAVMPVAAPKPVVGSNGLPPPPPLKPGRRSSSRALAHMPPPAPMVPTHAPDAAKASYSTMTERVIAPPPHVAAKKDPKLANNWKTKTPETLTDEEVRAMPDAEYMNDMQMAFFRHKLSILKQDIHNSAGATTEHLREDTVVVPDPADRATIEEEHALELRTRDRERKLLKKIEQSIARIDSGDYGYCDETGEPIGVGRLIARPTASLSLEAQQRRELKQKMFGD